MSIRTNGIFAAAALFATLSGYAQQSRGAITGRVLDPLAAVVAGAKE